MRKQANFGARSVAGFRLCPSRTDAPLSPPSTASTAAPPRAETPLPLLQAQPLRPRQLQLVVAAAKVASIAQSTAPVGECCTSAAALPSPRAYRSAAQRSQPTTRDLLLPPLPPNRALRQFRQPSHDCLLPMSTGVAVVRRPSRTWSKCYAGARKGQASSFFTTSPCTSVRRKSRP
jgi:hypothetical protein